jgi:anti-sigma28 factor (negative regulator of flagellin synthesis)
MKINETKPVGEVGRVMAQEPPVAPPPKDRVTVSESRNVRPAVTSARASATSARPARLKELEAKVRAGDYHPDPSRVADEILSDAEVDARLRALLIR